jgi:predicted Zn-dependent protease
MKRKIISLVKSKLRKARTYVREISPEYRFNEAYRSYQLGHFQEAGEKYCALLAKYPRNARYISALAELQREARQSTDCGQSEWKLVWQADPRKIWEQQWIRTALGPFAADEIVDTKHSRIYPRMIVADHLTPNAKGVIP